MSSVKMCVLRSQMLECEGIPLSNEKGDNLSMIGWVANVRNMPLDLSVREFLFMESLPHLIEEQFEMKKETTFEWLVLKICVVRL